MLPPGVAPSRLLPLTLQFPADPAVLLDRLARHLQRVAVKLTLEPVYRRYRVGANPGDPLELISVHLVDGEQSRTLGIGVPDHRKFILPVVPCGVGDGLEVRISRLASQPDQLKPMQFASLSPAHVGRRARSSTPGFRYRARSVDLQRVRLPVIPGAPCRRRRSLEAQVAGPESSSVDEHIDSSSHRAAFRRFQSSSRSRTRTLCVRYCPSMYEPPSQGSIPHRMRPLTSSHEKSFQHNLDPLRTSRLPGSGHAADTPPTYQPDVATSGRSDGIGRASSTARTITSRGRS